MDIDVKQLQDPEFWRHRCPDLRVSESMALEELCPQTCPTIQPEHWETCQITIHQDGYFAYDGWFAAELIDRLADCFDRLEEVGLPPAFCFVFDEAWILIQQLAPLLDELVADYCFLPAMWAWHVTSETQTAFAPHRDQVRDVGTEDDEHLDYLTFWIPLTDLNHLSSCISVLPASADPDYDQGTTETTIHNLQDVRTLQGSKGSVFCWATGLIHWGTKQSSLGEPRKSIGIYTQNPESECYDPPPIDLTQAYSLSQRLAMIGQQIYNYSRGADEKLLSVANQLLSQE